MTSSTADLRVLRRHSPPRALPPTLRENLLNMLGFGGFFMAAGLGAQFFFFFLGGGFGFPL